MPVLYLYLHFPNRLIETQPLKTRQQRADGPQLDAGEAGEPAKVAVLLYFKKEF